MCTIGVNCYNVGQLGLPELHERFTERGWMPTDSPETSSNPRPQSVFWVSSMGAACPPIKSDIALFPSPLVRHPFTIMDPDICMEAESICGPHTISTHTVPRVT